MEYFELLIGASVLLYLIYRIFKFGSYKGAMLDAEVKDENVSVGRQAMLTSSRISLYTLNDVVGDDIVGIETHPSLGAKIYLPLTAHETDHLIGILEEALQN